jgi:hypothetical protein
MGVRSPTGGLSARFVPSVRPNMSDPTVSYRVHQATGMISAQAGCSLGEAMQLLIIRADAVDESIEDVALDVIDGVTRFDP